MIPNLRRLVGVSFYCRLLPILLLALLTGCTLSPVERNIERAAAGISAGDEVPPGRLAYLRIVQKRGGGYFDKELNAYLNRVGQRLARVSQHPDLQFRFAVVNDSSPAAFALPGGYILLTRGLLVGLTNEGELAALLGHEIAHLAAGHSGALADSGAEQPAGVDWLANPYEDAATRLVAMRYSPEQEAEAKQLEIDYLASAGYDPLAALQLAEYFFSAGGEGQNPSWQNGLFHRHPFLPQQPAEIRRYIDENYPLVVGEAGAEDEFLRATLGLSQTRQGYALFDQARRLEKDGQLAEAIALYHDALLEAPDQALILCSLGLAYLRNEDLVPARRYLIKATNLDSDYYQSRLALGYIYQQKEAYPRALQQLEAGFKLLPTLEGGYLLAEAREQSGDKEGAHRLYLAVAKADADGKLGRNAAEHLRAMGD